MIGERADVQPDTVAYKKAVTSDSGYLFSDLFKVIVWQAQTFCQYEQLTRILRVCALHLALWKVVADC